MVSDLTVGFQIASNETVWPVEIEWQVERFLAKLRSHRGARADTTVLVKSLVYVSTAAWGDTALGKTVDNIVETAFFSAPTDLRSR